MIRPGDDSYFINSLEPEHLPNTGGNHTIIDSNVNLMAIVDPSDFYFHYMGSVSYPECEEDILWYVYEKEQWVSTKQMELFEKKLVKGNIITGDVRGNNREI